MPCGYGDLSQFNYENYYAEKFKVNSTTPYSKNIKTVLSREGNLGHIRNYGSAGIAVSINGGLNIFVGQNNNLDLLGACVSTIDITTASTGNIDVSLYVK